MHGVTINDQFCTFIVDFDAYSGASPYILGRRIWRRGTTSREDHGLAGLANLASLAGLVTLAGLAGCTSLAGLAYDGAPDIDCH